MDLVIDRAPMIDAAKSTFGTARVDTLREIAANKVCAVVGRAAIKDLVDLYILLNNGASLEQALADAAVKDAGVDPATLAWVLSEISLGADARLPGAVGVEVLDSFRRELIQRLRLLAFERASAKK